jgi:hypothetical protein
LQAALPDRLLAFAGTVGTVLLMQWKAGFSTAFCAVLHADEDQPGMYQVFDPETMTVIPRFLETGEQRHLQHDVTEQLPGAGVCHSGG